MDRREKERHSGSDLTKVTPEVCGRTGNRTQVSLLQVSFLTHQPLLPPLHPLL